MVSHLATWYSSKSLSRNPDGRERKTTADSIPRSMGCNFYTPVACYADGQCTHFCCQLFWRPATTCLRYGHFANNDRNTTNHNSNTHTFSALANFHPPRQPQQPQRRRRQHPPQHWHPPLYRLTHPAQQLRPNSKRVSMTRLCSMISSAMRRYIP